MTRRTQPAIERNETIRRHTARFTFIISHIISLCIGKLPLQFESAARFGNPRLGDCRVYIQTALARSLLEGKIRLVSIVACR